MIYTNVPYVVIEVAIITQNQRENEPQPSVNEDCLWNIGRITVFDNRGLQLQNRDALCFVTSQLVISITILI